MSSRSSRSGSARRSSISAARSASIRSLSASSRRYIGVRRRPGTIKPTARGDAVAPRIATSASLSSSRRRSSVMPKTARRITSRVIACMLGWSGKAVADRPARDRALGGGRDHVLVGAHALAVERRQHQLAPAQVLGALLQEQRAGAEQRLEDDVAPRRDRVHAIGAEEPLQGSRGRRRRPARPGRRRWRGTSRRARPRQCSMNGPGPDQEPERLDAPSAAGPWAGSRFGYRRPEQSAPPPRAARRPSRRPPRRRARPRRGRSGPCGRPAASGQRRRAPSGSRRAG